MQAATSETALVRHAPAQSASHALFFPGCQLAGIRPEQTLRLYDRLLELQPATGIWLDCCAAPAHWAGEMAEYSRQVSRLTDLWIAMGRPEVLTACSSCLLMFRSHLPAVNVQSVWTLLAGEPVSGSRPGPPLSLTDPCTARHDEETRSAVRRLLAAAGQPLNPLAMDEVLTECCGYGGLMDNAAPLTARKVREARVSQSESGFLTYCAMCRDQLARTGKPVVHLLDILFGDTAVPPTQPPQSPSARRSNRRYLQAKVLTRYSLAEVPLRQPWQDLGLVVAEPVAALLEERRILEEDIQKVLFLAAKRGSSFAHQSDGRLLASARLGEVSFWVEYRQVGQNYHIDRCWSHRMHIEGGKKA
jgi:hypothetical protein